MKRTFSLLSIFLFTSVLVGQFQPQTRAELDTAVDLWVSDSASAVATYGEINTWDVSLITDMSDLFKLKTTFNDDISNWDVSNVINMSEMFENAEAFNINISAWDVSSVTDMGAMFNGATSFNGDISTWDVSSVTDMSYLFSNASNFNQDISNWDVSSVTIMSRMFAYADAFNGDISSWDVSSVTRMSYMFYRASSFNGNISTWDVSSVTHMTLMFSSANSFNQDLSGWDVSNVTSMNQIFNNAISFNGDISTWDVSSVTIMTGVFFGASSFNGDISDWDLSNATTMNSMFSGADNFNQDLSGWDVSNVTNMNQMFSSADNFNQDISGWDVSSVTDMGRMFFAASSFNRNISTWDVSSVTNMEEMFGEASSISDENKCAIHTAFSSNANWPYDWSGLCDVVQTTYVPDDNFEQALIDLGYDDVLDDSVNTANISVVTDLDVSSKEISDLTGIEDFTALTDLDCEDNLLTSLDISNNTALTWLQCFGNQLTALDVSNNTALTELRFGNNVLTSLDVSMNTSLTVLRSQGNQLTTLNLSTNTALTDLKCNGNQLTALDLSNNIALTNLWCQGNQLTALDLSNNTVLDEVHCGNNQFSSLDLSSNTVLNELYCSDSDSLTSLNLSNNTALTLLWCYNNSLTSLDVSANTALTTLKCWNNQLTSLDVSTNTVLTELRCSTNSLTSLDVSANTALTTLACNINQLTALDVSANTALTYLTCSNNPELYCIQVADVDQAQQDWADNISDWMGFSIDCATIAGCMDSTSCNYNPGAMVDDGSCLYLDCAGNCGGTFAVNQCEVCVDTIPNPIQLSSSPPYTSNYTLLADGSLESPIVWPFPDVTGEGDITEVIFRSDWHSKRPKDMEILNGETVIASWTHPSSGCADGLNDYLENGLSSNCSVSTPSYSSGVLNDEINFDQAGNLTLRVISAWNTQGIYFNGAWVVGGDYCVQDCEGVWGGDATLDNCGVCNGGNDSCGGCTDIYSLNYDSSATFNQGCQYPDNGEYGLSFDGVDDYVLVSDDQSLNPTSAISISYWVKIPTNSSNSQFVVNKGVHNSNTAADDSYIMRIHSTGAPAMQIAGGGNNWIWIESSQVVNDGEWHHVAFVFNRPTSYFYIDGVYDDGGTYPSFDYDLNNTAENIYLGAGFHDDNGIYAFIDGSLDDIAIWDRALTQDEIQSSMSLGLSGDEDGLQGYWKFNAGADTLAYDHSGNANHGAINGASWAVSLTYVPDDNFEQALIDMGHDDVLDDYVVTDSINGVTSLDVGEKEISDLTGIEDFTALTELWCDSNQLTALDVSANTALTLLHCWYNELTALDVSTNTSLTSLSCSRNSLTTLDVSNNTALTYLNCRSNALTGLDVSANTALLELKCYENPLTALDVSANTALTLLHCWYNELTALDVSANTSLTSLSCSRNSLTTLDVSANTALTYLNCRTNALTGLDVSANTALSILTCYENEIGTLDVSNNTALTELRCNGNGLSVLDLSQNTSLTYLTCGYNDLTSLDVSNNTALTNLTCNNNQLTFLNMRNGTTDALAAFEAQNNDLTCIETLDPTYATENWTSIDEGVTFSFICDAQNQDVWHVATTGSDGSGNGTYQSPFATIQMGINAAGDGNTVNVAAGTYVENISYSGKSISIIGDDRETTIVDADTSGRAFYFDGDDQHTIAFSGFTIRNGESGHGAGIYIRKSIEIDLFDLNVNENNSTGSGAGGGIHIHDSMGELHNLRIENNEAYSGGGIYMGNSDIILDHVDVLNNNGRNRCGGTGLGSDQFDESTTEWTNSVFIGNTGLYQGSAMCMGDSVILSNLTITQNTAYNSALTGYGNWTITNSIISDNLISANVEADAEINFNGTLNMSYTNLSGEINAFNLTEESELILGEGNIDADPLFCEPDSGNYHIAGNSPCAGTGQDGADMGALGVGCGDIWFPPTIAAMADTSMDEDSELMLQLSADSEQGYDIYFEAQSDTSSVHVYAEDDSLHINLEPNWNGLSVITVMAYSEFDDEINNTTSFTLTVNPVNDEPMFHNLHALVGAGMEFHVPIHVSDNDMESLVVSLDDSWDYPDWLSLAANPYALTGTAPEPVSIDFPLHVSDRQVTVTDTFHLSAQFFIPRVTAVTDIPEDQGGRVYVSFLKSFFDHPNESNQMYTVFRRDMVDNTPDWVVVGSGAAIGEGSYTYEVATLRDSTADDGGMTQFKVVASMNEGNFHSDPAMGYSVDNIAPGVPQGLMAVLVDEGIHITWEMSADEDFQYFILEKSADEAFTEPEMFEMIDIAYLDLDYVLNESNYYRIAAVDHAGNISDYSDVVDFTVLATDLDLIPDVYALHQNYPNPFNPTTQIKYDLPEDAMVSITIYDIMGRSIRSLVNTTQSAGYRSIQWDATNNLGEPVSAGMYIYIIQAGEFRQTKKMVLLK